MRSPPAAAAARTLTPRPVGEVADKLLDPHVVKHYRHATGADEARHALAVDQGPGVIDLELLAAEEHHGERPKRGPLAEGRQSVLTLGSNRCCKSNAIMRLRRPG
jgi:hypothetical protein